MSTAEDQFFLITQSDGDVRIRRLTEAEVISALDADDETGELISRPYESHGSFVPDPSYWGANRCLIIKGTVVTPQPASIRYELR